ncbi:hypothetical protein NL676_023448 [Syzygium grande]|nr:hypothetical protein NL676_023448 [Syzygium grande]
MRRERRRSGGGGGRPWRKKERRRGQERGARVGIRQWGRPDLAERHQQRPWTRVGIACKPGSSTDVLDTVMRLQSNTSALQRLAGDVTGPRPAT